MTRRIKIADDDQTVLDAYRELFSPQMDQLNFFANPQDDQGLQASYYESGVQLLEEFRLEFAQGVRTPLCILDMRMPGLSGLELGEELRKIDPNVILLIITAYSDASVQTVRARLAQNVFYHHKPFHGDELLCQVESLVLLWNQARSTESKQRDLSEQNSKWQALVATLDDLVIEANADGEILNAWGARVEEWSEGQPMRGKTLEQFFGGGFAKIFHRLTELCLQRGTQQELDYPVQIGGDSRWLFTRLNPLDERRVLVRIEDVSWRKQSEVKMKDYATELSSLNRELSRANAQLQSSKLLSETANQAKSIFLSAVSHEFKGLLNIMIGLSELIPAEDSGPDNYGSILRESSQAMHWLIQDLLDYSRMDSDSLHLEEIPVLVQELVADVSSFGAQRASSKGLTFKTEIAPDLPLAFIGDPLRIRQILTNILSVALRFTSLGGLAFAISRKEGKLIIEIRGTSSTLESEKIARLFDPVAMNERWRTEEHSASAMGLALSRGLVRRMEGTLDVTIHEGHGSLFRMVIPLADATAISQEIHPKVQEGLDLLIVDDENSNRKIFKAILEKMGHQVTVCEDGFTALAELQAKKFDAAFVDLNMARMTGFEVIDRWRKFESDQKIMSNKLKMFAVSATDTIDERLKCQAGGFDGYLAKPLRMWRLEEHLRLVKP